MLHALLLSLLVTSPDPSTRTHAWRVVDQVSGSYRCEYACSTSATDAARDTACIQSALSVVAASGGVKWNALELPSGICLINAPLTVPYAYTATVGFEIYGHGPPWTRARAPIGDAQWNSGVPVRGTVIQSSLTSGTILTLGTDYTVTSVTAGTDTLTLNSANLLDVGNAISIQCGAGSGPCVLPSPLITGQYWVRSKSGDDITLSTEAGLGPLVNLAAWTPTGTVHVTNSPGGHWKLRNFAIAGNGADTRTTVGLAMVGANGIARFDIDNVAFVNLGTGVECFTCEDSVALGITFYGNGVGFWGDGNTNSNVFVGIECGSNEVCGHLLGSTNNFVGGTVQGSTQYGFRVQGGENHFSDIYFEDNSAVGAAISLEKASSWVLTDLDAGTDVITLDAAAPADDTQVYLWVDGSTSTLPAAVSEGTAYFVDDSSGNTMKLRTAASPAGSYIDFATAGTVLTVPGRTRMTIVTAAPGYANYVDNNHYATGDDISVWTGDNRIDEINFSQTLTLRKGTAGNVVLAAASCTDQGTGNYCEKRPNGNGGINYVFSPLSVSSPGMFWSGPSRLFFDMATAGGVRLSYECRDDLTYCQFRDSTNDVAFLTLDQNGVGAGDNAVVVKSAIFTVEGDGTVIGSLATDIITEQVAASGVTVDGVLLKDGDVSVESGTDFVKTDIINEFTSAAGVTIDSVLLKDGLTDGVDVSVLNTLATTLAAGIRDVKATCGAAGDGSTDDTTAIANCISGTVSGGSIYFPPGVYRTTAPLVLAAPISLIGPGVPSSSSIPAYADAGWAGVTYSGAVIRSAASSGNLVTSGPMTTHRVTISNLGFASTVAGAHTTVGLYVDGTSGDAPRVYLHNVAFYNLSGGLECHGCYGSQFDHVLGGGSRYPLYLDVNSRGNTVIAPYLYAPVTGFFILGNENTVQGGFVYNSGTVGFDIRGSSNVVEGVYFQTGAAITVTSTGKGNVLKNTYVDINAVSVAGVGNSVWRNGGYACPALTWESGASYNVADDTEYNVACTYTDNSGNATNTRTYPNANGILFDQGITAAGAIIDGGDFTVASGTDFVKTDIVSEFTAAAGVTVDGALCKDGDFVVGSGTDYVSTNTVSEFTAAAGVTADGVLLKDGYVQLGGEGDGLVSPNSSQYLTFDDDGPTYMTLTASGASTVNIGATALTIVASEVKTDVFNERVAAAGVTAEGVLLKDHAITIDGTGGGNVSRVLYNQYLTETTEGTSVETLKTFQIPAGTMAANGDVIEVEAFVECDGDGNSSTVAMYFNASTFETSTQTCAGATWHLHGILQRISPTTMAWMGKLDYSNTVGALHTYTGDTITWANAQDFTVRGTTPTQAGDVTLYSLRLTYHPAVP